MSSNRYIGLLEKALRSTGLLWLEAMHQLWSEYPENMEESDQETLQMLAERFPQRVFLLRDGSTKTGQAYLLEQSEETVKGFRGLDACRFFDLRRVNKPEPCGVCLSCMVSEAVTREIKLKLEQIWKP